MEFVNLHSSMWHRTNLGITRSGVSHIVEQENVVGSTCIYTYLLMCNQVDIMHKQSSFMKKCVVHSNPAKEAHYIYLYELLNKHVPFHVHKIQRGPNLT